MNIEERINEIWRPYLPDTPITRVSVHPPPQIIDPKQFITEYEEILHAKVQKLEKELLKEQLENRQIKIELQDIKDRLASGRFALFI